MRSQRRRRARAGRARRSSAGSTTGSTRRRQAALDRRPARKGRDRRLLDLLLHQLPANAPHLKAWDEGYRRAGLVIVGVHAPEFAFERVSSNVRSAVKRLGIRYPVRPGQRLPDLARIRQRLLAGQVPDRQDRPRALHALRRRGVRRDRELDPAAAGREGEDAAGRRCRIGLPATSRLRSRTSATRVSIATPDP